MAEGFGPDEELLSRRQAYDAAMQRLEAAREQSTRAAGFGDTHAGRRVAGELQAAEAAARAAAAYYNSGVDQHPENQYRRILEESEGVKAPEISTFGWIAQNPSVLEAVPLSDQQRADNARLAHVLKRVHEASNARGPSDPFSWSNYRGPMSEGMAEMETQAAELYGIPGTGFSGYAEKRRQLESPYQYRQFGKDEYGQPLPMAGQVMEALRPLSALYGGLSRFKDNFISGGAALSEGRVGDAAEAFAYAVPNLVSPVFHRGGEGMESDWRDYLSGRESAAIDLAADVPLFFTRGVFPARAGRGVSVLRAEDRIRQYRDEMLRPLLQQAARRHHPDVGGSVEAMKRANAAFDAGDVETLRQMAQ